MNEEVEKQSSESTSSEKQRCRFFRNIWALNFRILVSKWRHPVWTVVEVLVPLIIGIGMIFIRKVVNPPAAWLEPESYLDDKYAMCQFGYYGDWPDGALIPGMNEYTQFILGGLETTVRAEDLSCQRLDKLPFPEPLPPSIGIDIVPTSMKATNDGYSLLKEVVTSHTYATTRPPWRFTPFVVAAEDGVDCQELVDFIENAFNFINRPTYTSDSAFRYCTNGAIPPDCVATEVSPLEYVEYVSMDSDYLTGDLRTLGVLACRKNDVANKIFEIDIRLDPDSDFAENTKRKNSMRGDGRWIPYVAIQARTFGQRFLHLQNLVNSYVLHVTGERPISFFQIQDLHDAAILRSRNYDVDDFAALRLTDAGSIACGFCHVDSINPHPQPFCQDFLDLLSSSLSAADLDRWTGPAGYFTESTLNGDLVSLDGCNNIWRWSLFNDLSAAESLVFIFRMRDIVGSWMKEKMAPTLESLAPIEITERSMPRPRVYQDIYPFYFTQNSTWGLAWLCLLIPVVWRLISLMIYDKEIRVRELFKIMGVNTSTIWTSWYIFYLCYGSIFSLVCAGLCVPHYPQASYGLGFFLFLLYFICVTSYAVLVSSLTSKSTRGSLQGILILLCFCLPAQLVENMRPASVAMRRGLMVFFPTAFLQGMAHFLWFELSGIGGDVGVRWGNAIKPLEGISFAEILGFMVLDAVWMFLVGAYIYEVFPGESGVPRKWYFLFTGDFWREVCAGTACCKSAAPLSDETTREEAEEQEAFERTDGTHKALVDVKGIEKTFRANACCASSNDVAAVQGVTFQVLEGEIVSLLGHNGAGKTTTINMMIGMLAPTSGTAVVAGYDIVEHTSLARDNIGYCPQYDMLFDYMTVREHLYMYSVIRGISKKERDTSIIEACKLLEIEEKMHALSKTLSGGQKRRLSIAIALVGGVKTIFLDEPSSGMDPYTRRALWETLKQIKAGRAILLTTHIMEEADFLGDRIAIMAGGKMKCMGSSLFLKTHFGVGYTMTMTKKDTATVAEEDQLKKMMHDHLPGSTLFGNISLEISFRVPYKVADQLPDALEELENNLDRYGVTGFTVSVTTLEEVFLRVGRDEDADIEAITAQDEKFRKADEAHRFRLGSGNSLKDADMDSEMKRQTAAATKETAKHGASPPSSPRDHSSFWTSDDDAEIEPPNAGHSTQGGESTVAAALGGTEPEAEIHDAVRSAVVDSMHGAAPPTSPATATEVPTPIAAPKPTDSAKGYDMMQEEPGHEDADVFTAAQQLAGPRSCCNVWERHFRAQIVKRFHLTRRDLHTLCCQWIVPIIIILVTYAVGQMFLGVLNVEVEMDFTSMETESYYGSDLPQILEVGGTFAPALAGCKKEGAFEFVDSGITDLNDFDQYLMDTAGNHFQIRTAAFFVTEESPQMKVTVFHNSTFLYSLPSAIQSVNHCLLSEDTELSVRNHPLDKEQPLLEIIIEASTTLYTVVALSVIPATWGMIVVNERKIGAKRAQHISGLSVFLYWLTAYIWDFLIFIPPALAIWGVLEGFETSVVKGNRRLGFVVGELLFGFAAGPFAYLFSMLFNSPLATQVMMIFLGVFLPIIASILQAIYTTNQLWENGLKYLFFFFPHAAFNQLLLEIIYSEDGSYGITGDDNKYSEAAIFMVIEAIVFFIIVVLADTLRMNTFARQKCAQCSNAKCKGCKGCKGCQCCGCACCEDELEEGEEIEEDEDVVAERERLLNSDGKDEDVSLVLQGLRKVFPGRSGACGGGKLKTKVAVRDLWFSVKRGQCFGFLGVNGAGKSTSLQMLTGVIAPTEGSALLAGKTILQDPANLWPYTGYCPQFDSHIDYLTGREHLQLYLRLNLVPEKHIGPLCDRIGDLLGIQKYQNRKVKSYSGGNRRKLSVGLAFLGDPEVVFLDEPSTGVDPASRRKLWSIISHTTAQSGRAVILTTHSMEECEALCDRLAIMKDGQLACIGTLSHIREKFGKGYQLDVSFTRPDASEEDLGEAYDVIMKNFRKVLRTHFSEAKLVEKIGTHQKWSVPKSQATRSQLFRVVQDNKEELGIENYAVSDASLESIFVKFCQEDEEEEYEENEEGEGAADKGDSKID